MYHKTENNFSLNNLFFVLNQGSLVEEFINGPNRHNLGWFWVSYKQASERYLVPSLQAVSSHGQQCVSCAHRLKLNDEFSVYSGCDPMNRPKTDKSRSVNVI